MPKYPMTETIASREFACEGSQSNGTIVVRIGRPAPFPDTPDGDWYCPYIIDGMGEHREHFMGGVDALQALLLAISAVRVELTSIAEATTVRWLDSDDLGISLSANNDPSNR
jgi:hypothetical protein